MSSIIKGGVASVLIPWNPSVDPSLDSGVHELCHLLKAGTMVDPVGPEEELANGGSGSAGKGLKVGVRSADLNSELYASLIAAENGNLGIEMMIESIDGHMVVDECESGWESPAEIVHDDVNKKSGSRSVYYHIGGGEEGLFYRNLPAPLDLRGSRGVLFWIQMISGGVPPIVTFRLDDSPGAATPILAAQLPALDYTVWRRIYLPFSDPSVLGAIQSLGFHHIGEDNDLQIWIDRVLAVGKNIVVKSLIPRTEIEANEQGKFNALRILGNAFADTESNLIENNL